MAITSAGTSALRGSFFLTPVALSVALDSPQQSTWPPRQAAAQSSHRSTPCQIVHLGLPADLTAAVDRHRGSPGGLSSSAVSIRALVHARQQVLLDKTWTADEVHRNGSEVTLQLEAAHAYGPIAYVTVLLAAEPLTTAPAPAVGSVTPAAAGAAATAAAAGAATADRVSAAPWQLLTRLPLLMLPAPAAAEMRALFARMQQQAGVSAAAAYELYFAPLAMDMAFMLEAAAGGTGCSQYAALLLSQRLLAYLAAEDNPMPHCMELLRAAMSSRDSAPLPYRRQRSPKHAAGTASAGAAAAAAAAAPGLSTGACSAPVVTQRQGEGEVSVVESPFWPQQQEQGLQQRSFRWQHQQQQLQPQAQQETQQGCHQQLLLQQDSPEKLPLKQSQQKAQLQQQTHKHNRGQQQQQQQQQQQLALLQAASAVTAPAAATWRDAVWGFGDAALEGEYRLFKAGHTLGADVAFLAVKLSKDALLMRKAAQVSATQPDFPLSLAMMLLVIATSYAPFLLLHISHTMRRRREALLVVGTYVGVVMAVGGPMGDVTGRLLASPGGGDVTRAWTLVVWVCGAVPALKQLTMKARVLVCPADMYLWGVVLGCMLGPAASWQLLAVMLVVEELVALASTALFEWHQRSAFVRSLRGQQQQQQQQEHMARPSSSK